MKKLFILLLFVIPVSLFSQVGLKNNGLRTKSYYDEMLFNASSHIQVGSLFWIGLGSSAGRIVFTDATTDQVGFVNANIGINTTTPAACNLHIDDTGTGVNYIFMSNATTGNTLYSDGFLIGLASNEEPTFLCYEDEDMNFYTNGANRFVIKNDGNMSIGALGSSDLVTIGGSSPVLTIYDSDINLDVSSSAEQQDSSAIVLNAESSGTPVMTFVDDDGDSWIINFNTTNKDLQFLYKGRSDGSYTLRATIDTTGAYTDEF